MKKTAFRKLAVCVAALYLLAMSGCSQLFIMHDSPELTVEPSPTATSTTIVTSTPTQETPTPSPTVTQPAATLPPDIWEEARFQTDLDGDGVEETIIVSSIGYDVGTGNSNAVSLEVRSKTGGQIVFTDCLSYLDAFLTWTKDGKPCVLVGCSGEAGEDLMTYICSFDGLTPVLRNEVYETVEGVDGTRLVMRSWIETIGDWWYTREYELANDFTLTPVSDMMIDTEGREPLITICEVSVEMWEDGTYVAGMLPADTSIWPVSADGEGHLIFRLQDGRTGRITYTRDDYYGYTLSNGVNVDECFENVEYWG